MKKNAPLENQTERSDSYRDSSGFPPKQITTLARLCRGPVHRFEAEDFGDHCLHSTVSQLEREYGIEIMREWIEVPTRFGRPTRVKRYWVSPADRIRANTVVGDYVGRGE